MAGLTTSAIGAGMSLFNLVDSNKRRRNASNELNNYERQTLDNAFEEMPISLEGYKYMQDENARTMANAVDTLRGGGIRGAIAGAPRVVAAGNDLNADIARGLDEQINRRSYASAGDNARIEGITEARDMQNINALSSQLNAANQDRFSSMLGLGSSIAYGIRNFQPNPTPNVSAISANPAGPVNTMPANPYSFNTPYSFAPASTVNPNDIYGDMFMYDDMINKY